MIAPLRPRALGPLVLGSDTLAFCMYSSLEPSPLSFQKTQLVNIFAVTVTDNHPAPWDLDFISLGVKLLADGYNAHHYPLFRVSWCPLKTSCFPSCLRLSLVSHRL